jgi:hypothetical protein
MPSTSTTIDNQLHAPLFQYVSTVYGMHQKIARINENQQDVAASLSRAAAALRSIANARRPNSSPEFGK